MGLVMGLKNAGIPVRVMTDDDTQDVATARRDVVWVASGNRARGLERKVVVVHDERSQYQLHTISRCISQLVVVINMDPPSGSSCGLDSDGVLENFSLLLYYFSFSSSLSLPSPSCYLCSSKTF